LVSLVVETNIFDEDQYYHYFFWYNNNTHVTLKSIKNYLKPRSNKNASLLVVTCVCTI
jgi:hypothetical protein